MSRENMNYIETEHCNLVLDQVISDSGVCKYEIYIEYPDLRIEDDLVEKHFDFDVARREFFELVKSYR